MESSSKGAEELTLELTLDSTNIILGSTPERAVLQHSYKRAWKNSLRVLLTPKNKMQRSSKDVEESTNVCADESFGSTLQHTETHFNTLQPAGESTNECTDEGFGSTPAPMLSNYLTNFITDSPRRERSGSLVACSRGNSSLTVLSMLLRQESDSEAHLDLSETPISGPSPLLRMLLYLGSTRIAPEDGNAAQGQDSPTIFGSPLLDGSVMF